MKLLKNLLLNIVIYSWLLWVFAYFELGMRIFVSKIPLQKLPLDDFSSLMNLWLTFLCLWIVFWLLNSPVKKILTLVSIPVNVFTLGLFSLVINILIFFLFEWVVNDFFAPEIRIQLGTLLQVFILSIIMSVSSSFLRKIT